jgi:hypothetical protein
MNGLTILDTAIRRDSAGRYCLNDAHRAAGGEDRHGPNRFTRTEGFLALTKEQAPELAFAPAESIHGGSAPGTYVTRELVYAYAMWISPKFHLAVIRAFDALATGSYTAQAAGLSAAAARAHQQRMQILRELDATPRPGPVRRAALHEQLATVSSALGLSIPPLEAFEPKPLPDPFDSVRQAFWQAITVLESAYGAHLDHHVKELMCAYNVPEVSKLAAKHGMPLASASDLAKALSGDRRFIQYTGVSSRHRKVTVRCYCFRSVDAQEAIDATINS